MVELKPEMEVKKGVIAAAGLGTRFLPFVKGCTKNLVPILNKPQLQYVVEEFLGAGVNQIAIVHNHGDPQIKRYFTPDPELEKTLKESGKDHLLVSLKQIWKKAEVLKFIPQPRRLPYGNATPILATKSFINNEPFVYAFADDMIVEDKPGQYLSHMIKIFKKYHPSVVLGAQKMPKKEVTLYGMIDYLNDPKYPNRAAKIFEKPKPEEITSQVTTFGRFIYSPKVFNVLADLPTSKRGGKIKELWMADANNVLAQTDVAIAEPIKNGFWITTGDPLRWLKTNLIMGLKDEEMGKELKKFIKEKVD